MRNALPARMMFFGLALLLPAHAQESGTIAAICGEVTRDGRPILWKNRDSQIRENEVAFFRGARYDFFGVIDRNDTSRVWMGLNTAGFALVHSQALDQDSSTTSRNGVFIKQALGQCGRVGDLERLLTAYIDSSGNTRANYACMDAFGMVALFEASNRLPTRITPTDTALGEPGFLARADFAMTGQGGSRSGSWRYQRAQALLSSRAFSHDLDLPYVMQTVARDLASEEIDPYPLPFPGSLDGAPAGFIPTRTSLNGYRTVSCVAIQGVRPGEDPRLSTLWVILGEPVCGISLPLWPASGEIPSAFDGENGSDLNRTLLHNRERFYPKKSWPQHLNTEALTRGRRNWLSFAAAFENEIFAETASYLRKWRRSGPDAQEMSQLQNKLCRSLLRAL